MVYCTYNLFHVCDQANVDVRPHAGTVIKLLSESVDICGVFDVLYSPNKDASSCGTLGGGGLLHANNYFFQSRAYRPSELSGSAVRPLKEA